MVSKIIGFITLLLAFSPAEKGDRLRETEEFLYGYWTVKDTANTPLRNVHFVGGNCISFHFQRDRDLYNILKKYEYSDLSNYPKNISLNVYTKDLVSKKKLIENPIYIEILDKNTIQIRNKASQESILERTPINTKGIIRP